MSMMMMMMIFPKLVAMPAVGNESVPIQLAQCRFLGRPFSMLKY